MNLSESYKNRLQALSGIKPLAENLNPHADSKIQQFMSLRNNPPLVWKSDMNDQERLVYAEYAKKIKDMYSTLSDIERQQVHNMTINNVNRNLEKSKPENGGGADGQIDYLR